MPRSNTSHIQYVRPLKLAGVRPPNHVTPGLLLRGFLAVWVLSLGIGILWLWQLFRLWRFR